MRYSGLLSLAVVAAGVVVSGSVAKAEDPYWDRRDQRHDRQDLRRDYARVDDLRADMARDQWRLNEDLRCGRLRAAEREARDMARDQRTLNAKRRDIRRDRSDMYWDRRDR